MNDDHDDDEADLVSAEGGEKARGGAAVAFEPTALKDSDQSDHYDYHDCHYDHFVAQENVT